MASIPPPQGLGEGDYETIEAAVTETVRGRWFLSEFARRNRSAEMRQLLDAIGRLEANVVASQAALPSADPSVRLLIQRIKEVSAQLDTLALDMRAAGIEDRFAQAVGLQARAVAGMMRGAPPAKPLPPAPPPAAIEPPRADTPKAAARMPRADLPPELAPPPPAPAPSVTPHASDIAPTPTAPTDDPRRAALSGLDGLTMAEKLALFS